MSISERDTIPVALVLAGGVGLGAYQAGAYAALHARRELRPRSLAASSIGAINAAVIAGSSPDQRTEHLNALWQVDADVVPPRPLEDRAWQRWRHAQKWANALGTRIMGAAGHFTPRIQTAWDDFVSLYDLSPLRARLARLVDFGRLNSGDVRLCVATTDVARGELVVFDTARGDRIGEDHLFASCGLLPEFAPVEIDGRLLGDGGLAANAPFEPVLDERGDGDLTCFILDLYARDGVRPPDLETAVARKSDLIFANQTLQRLEAYRRLEECRLEIGRYIDAMAKTKRASAELAALERKAARGSTTILHLSYRPFAEEAGPERGFDYSSASIARRWQAGAQDMAYALHWLDRRDDLPGTGFVLKSIRRPHEDAIVQSCAAE